MTRVEEKPTRRRWNVRLIVAELLYLVLAIIATLAFDGIFRTVMWLYFIGLALKTLMAAKRDEEP